MNTNTVELWRGPSRIDGSPLVVLMSGVDKPSSNRKTGDMLQVWILRADVSPVEAVKTGADVAMCGACPHKGTTCYVNVGQAPRGIWASWKAGNVGHGHYAMARGRKVRLGAYGDPAAVPTAVWTNLVAEADGWTGYTHQWKVERLRDVLKYCQLSADNETEARHAHEHGYGSFRVMAEHESPMDFEMLCPADGVTVTCETCMACHGKGAANVAIYAHGSSAAKFEPTTVRRTLPVLN